MTQKKFVVVLGIALLLMGVTLGWLTLNFYLPSNPKFPYFPESRSRIGGVHWLEGEFQPTFLYTFEKDGNYFLKAVYRDKNDRVKASEVLIGSDDPGVFPLLSVAGEGDVVQKINNLSEYRQYIHIGQRIRLTYIMNSKFRQEDYRTYDVLEPMPENEDYDMKSLCERAPAICFSAKVANTYPEEYYNIEKTGNIPDNISFSGTFINTDLYEE